MKISDKSVSAGLSRRQFVTGLAAGGVLGALGMPGSRLWAMQAPAGAPELSGQTINLNIGQQRVNFTGKDRFATTVNGSLPAPTLRLKEGDKVTINVTNRLGVDSSIHWHGIILPSEMDGVPGFSFDGIQPEETFTYQFSLNQSGTYWYHSHSGFQEQTGLYGALVIEPKEPYPFTFDRDYVVMLSDWTDESPMGVYHKLKKLSHYYNFNERTFQDTWRDIQDKGVKATYQDRAMWNQMRMSQTDISDVTGYTYTYLMNGVTPAEGWKGLFRAGEKILLRFINSAAMTFFDVRIPGLKMTVVAADGQYVEPVTVDEFRIGVAETYDVLVEPTADQAYTLFAQTIDRSGYARGTLTPDYAMVAEVPEMDPVPLLSHGDMGMGGMHDMHGMDHSAHSEQPMAAVGDPHAGHQMKAEPAVDHSAHQMQSDSSMDHSAHNMASEETTKSASQAMDHSGHDMSSGSSMDHSAHQSDKAAAMDHSAHQTTGQPAMDHAAHAAHGTTGQPQSAPVQHAATEYGPHVDMRAEDPQYRLDDPGIGLRDNGRRVLTYADLRNLYPTPDPRPPEREIELHLTGNMSRYMWSINGVPFADAEPLHLKYGERVRITLVNDTMMNHPMHLHGMWSDLETGDDGKLPRKHTVIVQPGSKISYRVTADAKGRWAYHCHLIYHMMGMFREVRVS
ncbi:copper resistance system multicopper oxidase [Neptuniibacter sp. CAU 1671]|uniref:copper resistance system multicopper oxidase n=1 Tax=Neptuniibacter sp. CAU 1671 TaxID=3032593 RepID=UPI0023DC963D|nr:copper resistance system multicopper oxidase [Neptuniibacter sp. CAU 1671]MDF2181610.1 copper resistance system multicopper oxidase [Neptuniibacter sp. CAU 1671]